MSDSESNSSALFWGIAVLVLLLVIVAYVAGGKSFSSASSQGDPEVRIKPVARVEISAAPAGGASGAPRSGKDVYAAVCGACHDSGAAGAPKAGDKAAWGPRIGMGKDALYKSALEGKNAMPARGGNSSLPDAEVKAAVDHLISLVK